MPLNRAQYLVALCNDCIFRGVGLLLLLILGIELYLHIKSKFF